MHHDHDAPTTPEQPAARRLHTWNTNPLPQTTPALPVASGMPPLSALPPLPPLPPSSVAQLRRENALLRHFAVQIVRHDADCHGSLVVCHWGCGAYTSFVSSTPLDHAADCLVSRLRLLLATPVAPLTPDEATS